MSYLNLLNLEKKRKFILKFLIIYTIVFTIFFMFVIGFIWDKFSNSYLYEYNELKILIILLIAISLRGFYKFSVAYFDEHFREFKSEYKDAVLKPLFKRLNFKYSKFGHVHALDIMHSGLLDGFDTQDGNDFVRGSVGDVRFSFSDITLSRIKYSLFKDIMLGYLFSRTKKPKFMGLFYTADFNKSIKTPIKITSKPKLFRTKILMDNYDFNELFNVYCSDMVFANYILTPVFMERLLTLENFAKGGIKISFDRNKIFIVLNKGKDSFEPNLFKSVKNRDNFVAIRHEIFAVLSIIKNLNLNEKIW